MVNKTAIIPTGDEILNGTVIDTNSPAIMGLILEYFPSCEVTRFKPIVDDEDKIIEKVDQCVQNGDNLIVLIGGSGGGHRYVSSLGKDFTHSAILKYLPDAEYKEIYGTNGHLWSKLIAAKKSNSIILTVPGPYVEAVEAAKAAINAIKNGENEPKVLVDKIALAVLNQYPAGGDIK